VLPRKAAVSCIGASSPTRSAWARSLASAWADARDHACVVDQGGAGQFGGALCIQPVLQTVGHCHTVGQIGLPLQQAGAACLGLCGQRLVGMARDAQQQMPRPQQLPGHGQAHAARGAGEDVEVLAHVCILTVW